MKENEESVPLYRHTNLQVIFAVTLMAVMGVVSISPAFPRIAEHFKISAAEVRWLIIIFTLPGIFLTPVLGVMADRFGRKKILGPSLFLFGIAGASCAFAPSFQVLLLFRFFQGVGAASLGALNTTVIGDIYQGPRLSEAMGYNGGILNVGTASYPAIGGLLAALGWNYPFLLPLLALPIGFLVLFVLDNPEPKEQQDLKSYLKTTWQSFQDTRVLTLFTGSLLIFIILYGAFLTYLPFLMKEWFHSSTVVIGLVLSATSVASGLSSTQLGRLTRKFKPKKLMLTGALLYCVSMAMIPLMKGPWWMLAPVFLYGLANGLNITIIHSLLAGLSPIEYRAAFMCANGMVLRMGQTLGPVVVGSFFAIWGFTGAFLGSAVLAVFMFLLFLRMPVAKK